MRLNVKRADVSCQTDANIALGPTLVQKDESLTSWLRGQISKDFESKRNRECVTVKNSLMNVLLKKDEIIDANLRSSGDMSQYGIREIITRNTENSALRQHDSYATDFSDNRLNSKHFPSNNLGRKGSPSSPTLKMSKTIVTSNTNKDHPPLNNKSAMGHREAVPIFNYHMTTSNQATIDN